jgi:hypothetical protein
LYGKNSFDKSIFIYQTTWRHIPEDLFFIVTAITTSNLTIWASHTRRQQQIEQWQNDYQGNAEET